MYILQIEEEGAATREHEERPDVAPEILYNIFCAGCQGEIFCGGIFSGGIFFGAIFLGWLAQAIFLARIQKGVGTPAQPD